jgi:hypothetical protein
MPLICPSFQDPTVLDFQVLHLNFRIENSFDKSDRSLNHPIGLNPITLADRAVIHSLKACFTRPQTLNAARYGQETSSSHYS